MNLPLILAFHDKEQSPAELEYDTRFSDKELNQNKIVVYPRAVNVGLHTIPICAITHPAWLGYMAIRSHSQKMAKRSQ